VISAVGHEIDFTISDFAADLRAPTPSAAAELVVGRKDAFEERLGGMTDRLVRALRERILSMRTRFASAEASYVFREPGNLVRQYRQRLDTAELRMAHELKGRLGEGRQRLDDLALRLRHEIRIRHQSSGQDVRRLERQLAALNPLAVLLRGYSVTRDEGGRVIRAADDVEIGQSVRTQVAKGTFSSEVTAKDRAGRQGEGEGQ
jgi:exodeoxyribonuclease VII large subunit